MPVAVDGNARLPAFLEPLAHAPFHIFADGAALLLREGSHHRQEHLGDGLSSVNAFLLEKELHAHRLQFPYIVQTVHGIPRKAADALGDDVVDFPRPAICYHLLKSGSMPDAGAADSFIRIQINQLPVIVERDLMPEGFHLVLQAAKLFFAVRANPAVGSHALPDDVLPTSALLLHAVKMYVDDLAAWHLCDGLRRIQTGYARVHVSCPPFPAMMLRHPASSFRPA